MRAYYEQDGIQIFHGDCREVLPALTDLVDVVIADPPYGETSLDWDAPVRDWLGLVAPRLAPAGSLWCFGSLRFFMAEAAAFAGWSFAQDVVWEKHNGSNLHHDRFRRVHEHVCQFYRGRWETIFKAPQVTHDATARTIRNRPRPTQFGERHLIDRMVTTYRSVDGGPRLMRSVLSVRSCHGYADHPTQKPLGILTPLIQYSCPPGGLLLDPFAGAGSALVAAKLLGRRAIGIEISEEYCRLAVQRLQQATLPLHTDEVKERHSNLQLPLLSAMTPRADDKEVG